jgi:hypothetical protein
MFGNLSLKASWHVHASHPLVTKVQLQSNKITAPWKLFTSIRNNLYKEWMCFPFMEFNVSMEVQVKGERETNEGRASLYKK